MSIRNSTKDEESFVVLGSSSPRISLDYHLNGNLVPDSPPVYSATYLTDIMEKKQSVNSKCEINPSSSSIILASNIISEQKTTADLQQQFGVLLDENRLLKDALKENNDFMRKQFLMIDSCQEDMLNAHKLHKEKFDETKLLIEKLKAENKKLKHNVAILAEGKTDGVAINNEVSSSRKLAEPSSMIASQGKKMDKSAYEFVVSPDEDTVNKLTTQLELVEKQRRQVIVENDKLTWQKESLEHIIDSTSKERDLLKEKLRNAELKYSERESGWLDESRRYKDTLKELEKKLLKTDNSAADMNAEIETRDKKIRTLEANLASLQADLKAAQLTISGFEISMLNQPKENMDSTKKVESYREQINELIARLKEVQTTVFHPVRFSISVDKDQSSSEYITLISNVKLYDKTLKHLAELLNNIINGVLEGMSKASELVALSKGFALDKNTEANATELKGLLDAEHKSTLNYIGQIKSTLGVFEGIFHDYKEVLKNLLSRQNAPSSGSASASQSVEMLSAALVSRSQELAGLQAELGGLRALADEREALKAQALVYKMDFEAERESRAKVVGEKEDALADLRTLQRRNQELVEQMEQLRRIDPGSVAAVAGNRAPPVAPRPQASASNTVYVCPKCNEFSCGSLHAMQDHVEMCLDF